MLGLRQMGLLFVLLILASFCSNGYCNLVFEVHHKFKGQERSLSAMKEHDVSRHGRLLANIDIPLAGNSQPTDTGLYYTKFGLGSPSKIYHVQVDTGSDILWVNCIECSSCPKKTGIGNGFDLTLFDPKSSTTSHKIACDEPFCADTMRDGRADGCSSDLPCNYKVVYGDGSSTAGYFVKDIVTLEQVSGNQQTSSTNGTIVFGCGAKQQEGNGRSEALDGILGFGQSNASMISQLAASGKVKKAFAHCLDGEKDGGIFAIGEVLEPKLNGTPIIPNRAHYNVVMKTIEVGGSVIDIETDTFNLKSQSGAVIDSGTTLAYLPERVYQPLMTKIMAKHPDLKLHTVQDIFICFEYDNNVDDDFPVVKFHFDGGLTMPVFPHEYLFQIHVKGDDRWCVGWQNSGSKGGSKDMTLLGDLVLQNKLVVYDLQAQTIAWTEYNCSSSIKMKDGNGGPAAVVSHRVDSGSSLPAGRILTFLLVVITIVAA